MTGTTEAPDLSPDEVYAIMEENWADDFTVTIIAHPFSPPSINKGDLDHI